MDSSTDGRDIGQLLERRRRALLDADAETLARLLHPHYRYVDSLGRELSRDMYLESRRSREVEFDRHDISAVEVTVLEPRRAALLTCRVCDSARFLGKPFTAEYRAVHICVRADGEWLFLFGQSTAISASGC